MLNEKSRKVLDDNIEYLKVSIKNIELSDLDKEQCDALRIPLQQAIIELENILYPTRNIGEIK